MFRKLQFISALLAISFIFCDSIYSAQTSFDYGGAFRLRHESWDYVADFGTLGAKDRDYFRLRSNLWGRANFNENIGLQLGITNEMKYYQSTYLPFETRDTTSDTSRFDEDELVIDNLYLDFKKVGGLPVDIRIGRQNFLFTFGEMFLIGDGTPGDGSRTYYFDAIRATWTINQRNNVDFVYLMDTEKDEYLPSLYPARSNSLSSYVNNKRLLNASDEKGAIIYFRSKVTDNITIEPYYIWKEEDEFLTTPKLSLNTLGARAVMKFGEWKLRGEFAHQFGEYDDNENRSAYGGYIFGGRKHMTLPFKPEWEFGYVYMSGDDPNTTKHEGWNPLWSRSPQWNEISIYPMVLETMKDSGPIPSYWTNLHLYLAGIKFDLNSATTLGLTYQYLEADESTKGLNASMFSNSGTERGNIATLMLKHRFTKRLDGYLQIEMFDPGDFYNESKSETSWFMRWELQYKF